MATLSGLLAIGMGRGWIRLADCAKSLMDKPQLECKQHQGSVSCVALSGFGQLATTSYDGSVKLVDTHTGVERVLCSREISEEMLELGLEEAEAGPVNLRGHTDAVTAAAFSPCGTYLATVGWDEQLIIWNVATGEADASLLGAQCGRLRCVAFSPLGTSICSGGDHAIIVWCADSGDIRTVLQTATPCTISVVFLDEHRVLGACTDGAIRLWCSNAVDDTENDANADEWKAQLLYKDDGSLGRVVFSGWRWEGGVRAGTLAACTDQGIRIVDAVSWSASGLIRSHGHGGRCICQGATRISRVDVFLLCYPAQGNLPVFCAGTEACLYWQTANPSKDALFRDTTARCMRSPSRRAAVGSRSTGRGGEPRG